MKNGTIRVLGLDYLLSNPSIITSYSPRKDKQEVLIPFFYVTRISDLANERSSRGESAKKILRTLSRLNIYKQYSLKALPSGTMLRVVDTSAMTIPKSLNGARTSTHMIMAALDIKKKKPDKEIVVMTNSDKLSTIAAWFGLKVERPDPTVHSGRRHLLLSPEHSTMWRNSKLIPANTLKEYFTSDPPLFPNEFVEFSHQKPTSKDGIFELIGRFDVEADKGHGAIVPLRYTQGLPYGIRPQTPGQAMLCEALLAPAQKIPLVVAMGTFGTGKTFLTVAAGMGQIDQNQYERIFVCPRDSVLGQEVGFMPGNLSNKARSKAKPIEDNIQEVLRAKSVNIKSNAQSTKEKLREAVDLYIKRNVEFDAIINMGGRSLSNSYIILDEFQDIEQHQAKVLLSRIGVGSKMILMGDPAQCTNPHLSATNNGLAYAINNLTGNPNVAVVTLFPNEIVRSTAARAIAECF